MVNELIIKKQIDGSFISKGIVFNKTEVVIFNDDSPNCLVVKKIDGNGKPYTTPLTYGSNNTQPKIDFNELKRINDLLIETPMQKFFDYIENEWDGDEQMLIFYKQGLIEEEKEAFIDFGNKLLEAQVGQNGCGCGKDGGGDYPEKLFEKTYGK